MGAKRVASAAGTAALVYVALSGSGRLSPVSGDDDADTARRRRRSAEEGEERWPERAPASWREAVAVLSRTAGFAYAETLGKWPLGDIAFGINHYMRIQVLTCCDYRRKAARGACVLAQIEMWLCPTTMK
jgi:hypothetical protein